MPSRTALYSDRFGIQTGLVGHGGTALHYNVDWGPTLMQMLDSEPYPIWDGQSFADTNSQRLGPRSR